MNCKKFSKIFLEKVYIDIFKKNRKVIIMQFNIIALIKLERYF